ncbi:MAG: hypothetical protein EXR51_09705 [Dehalococcoidia bacterium]|nr:hypothetical protein [Dehalococcoidia bacterium]
MSDDFFRLALPAISLSIEQNTENVAHDRRFHVLHQGTDVGNYPTLKKAREHFQRLKEASGYQVPSSAEGGDVANKEHIERLLDAATSYWSQSHKFRSGGGRGGRGGV